MRRGDRPLDLGTSRRRRAFRAASRTARRSRASVSRDRRTGKRSCIASACGRCACAGTRSGGTERRRKTERWRGSRLPRTSWRRRSKRGRRSSSREAVRFRVCDARFARGIEGEPQRGTCGEAAQNRRLRRLPRGSRVLIVRRRGISVCHGRQGASREPHRAAIDTPAPPLSPRPLPRKQGRRSVKGGSQLTFPPPCLRGGGPGGWGGARDVVDRSQGRHGLAS